MNITVSIGALERTLWGLALLVLLGHLFAMTLSYGFGHDHFYGLVPFLDLDTEQNIPTFFSTVLLLIISLALAIVALGLKGEGKRDSRYWIGLALIFLFLAIDENISIHERISDNIRQFFDLQGFLFFAWLVPYGLAICALGALYLKFLFRLPKPVRILMFYAAAFFLGGAVGLEAIAGTIYEASNEDKNLLFATLSTFEECFEIVGLLIFFRAISNFLQSELKNLQISFT